MVRNHRWFKGINWEEVSNQLIEPPWKPEIDSPIDTRYFEFQDVIESPRLWQAAPNTDYKNLFKDF